jgi:hypothetical protein
MTPKVQGREDTDVDTIGCQLGAEPKWHQRRHEDLLLGFKGSRWKDLCNFIFDYINKHICNILCSNPFKPILFLKESEESKGKKANRFLPRNRRGDMHIKLVCACKTKYLIENIQILYMDFRFWRVLIFHSKRSQGESIKLSSVDGSVRREGFRVSIWSILVMKYCM